MLTAARKDGETRIGSCWGERAARLSSRLAQQRRADGAATAGARRRPARGIVTEGGDPRAGFRGAGIAGGVERGPKDAPFSRLISVQKP